jgi:hypothetical protein
MSSSSEDPRKLIESSCKTNDIATLTRVLEASHDDPTLLNLALLRSVSAGHISFVRFVLEEKHMSASDLTPQSLSTQPTTELLQLLVDHGFDINKPAETRRPGKGGYLLQRVCHDEELVKWCLEHGAKVNGIFTDPYSSPPLLQTVASLGTVPIFKLLLSKGAPLEGRILHVAAGNVGSRPGTDPDRGRFKVRMEMVRYLVEEVGLDVNELDSEESMGNFWGTPLCYSAKNPFDEAEVVKFLLEKGADPYIKERMDEYHNAFSYAKEANNVKISEVLEEWKAKHNKESIEGSGLR